MISYTKPRPFVLIFLIVYVASIKNGLNKLIIKYREGFLFVGEGGVVQTLIQKMAFGGVFQIDCSVLSSG